MDKTARDQYVLDSCISRLPTICDNKIEIEQDSQSRCSIIQEIEFFQDSFQGCPVLHPREHDFKQSGKQNLFEKQDLQYSDKENLKYMNLSVFYNAPISIVEINYKRKIQFVNKSAEEMFQYKSKELIGKELDIIIPQSDDLNLSKFISKHLDIGISSYTNSKTGVRRNGENFACNSNSI